MIARFTDRKALAFAYADLLAAGVPPSAMCETRHRVPHPDSAANGSLRMLSALNHWFRKQRTLFAGPQSRPRNVAFSLPDVHWAALQIDAPGREDTVFGVVAHRQGTLVS